MSTMDPGKLKVVELRAELTSRGLDIKGNKPVLVQRLKEALEKELKTTLPNTTVVDTSNEDFNASQESVEDDEKDDERDDEKDDESTSETDAEVTSQNPDLAKQHSEKPIAAQSESMEVSTNDGNDAVNDQDEEMEEESKTEVVVDPVSSDGKTANEERAKGDKRRRSSPSPQRVQRKRSRSPIKENEPELNNDLVALSWYDSDLNLQIEKQMQLSAKPLQDGAFGYSWAGARTTHGVKVGKVCYEVKITEEMKWDDLIKQLDKKRETQRSDRRDRRRQDRKGRDSGKRGQASEKSKNLAKSDSKDNAAEAKEASSENNEKDTTEVVTENETKEVKEEQLEEVSSDTIVEIKTEPVVKDETITEPDVKEEIKTELDSNDVKSTEIIVKDEKTSDAVATGETVVNDIADKNEFTEKDESKVNSDEKPEAMEVEKPPQLPTIKHLFRCGWSMTDSSLQLGEVKHSFGFDSQGKFVHDKEFIVYGIPFAVGDVIGAYVNIDDENVEFSFTINGVYQGLATTVPRSEFPEEDFALFPHVLTRNLAFEINLGNKEEPWFPHPSDLSDYVYIQVLEDKFQGPLRPASRSECEVIMMCGLPGSGKTHWVQKIIEENSDKKYTVIGTSHLLDRMTIDGKPLKDTYKNRWNIILDKLMKCANTLVDRAAVRRRHIIIDQTNVFSSAQRRKMRLFEGFKRRAVIVVVSDEEQAKRRAEQEAKEGKEVPDSALLEMKANMSLPKCGDSVEEVQYVELNEEEAKAVVQKYNSEGKAAGFGSFSRRGGYRDSRGSSYKWNRNSYRRDYRDGYRDNRPYQNNRFRGSGGFPSHRPAGGDWNRDFNRDNRGPPRDARNRSGSGGRYDRPIVRERNPSSGYNRNSRSQGGRNQSSNWQNPSAWQTQSWGGNQGGPYQNWGQNNWGSGQSQWKSGYGQGGYGQTGYGNWNYYGQYANNWQVHK